MTWYEGQSFEKPDLIETESSNTTVYIRRNINEVKRFDEKTKGYRTYFEFEETKIEKSEYLEYLKASVAIEVEQQRADIDYIALMAGIDLEEV